MKKTVTMLILGAIFGLIIGLSVPASAHHQPEFRSLSRRVNALADRVSVLEDRTWKLNFSGNYTGPISGSQIDSIDGSKVDPPFLCGYGDPAIWSFTSLGC